MAVIGKIGFVGSGTMGEALIRGLISAGLAEPSDIIASDWLAERRKLVKLRHKVATTPSNAEVAEKSEVIFLCVKPKDVARALEEMKKFLGPSRLIVSIAAGIPTSFIETRTPEGTRVVRVMPNLPCVVDEVAAALAPGKHATIQDKFLVHTIFEALGICLEMPEELLDAITGLSGSGPGFAAELMQGLIDGGVRVGIPKNVAKLLVAQTFIGAAKMIMQDGLEPAELTRKVATPGGTTLAGLAVMEKGKVKETLAETVVAATNRSKELAKGNAS